MEIVVASHPSALLHDTGFGHPERPERLRAVRRGVDGAGLDIVDIEAPRIDRSELALVHEASYIEMVETFCRLGGGALDMDTWVSEDSWVASLTAAGAVRAVIEELRSRSDAAGFAMTRPPGHHALPSRAMGFCIFNNVGVSAALLRSRGERVAILDWDVHHGNGTQSVFADDPGTLYMSIHQANFYPFEGQVDDINRAATKGTTVNIPLPAGTAGDVYRRAWSELVIPVMTQFTPDWVLISSGYDAHASDPLADMALRSEDYGYFAARLAEVHPANRTVVALEGGYDLAALEESTAWTLRGLAGIEPAEVSPASSPIGSVEALATVHGAIAEHWRV